MTGQQVESTTATRNAAAALGLEETHGAVVEGKLANLVVLNSDPSKDISAIRDVAMVIKRGKTFPRTDFESSRTTDQAEKPKHPFPK